MYACHTSTYDNDTLDSHTFRLFAFRQHPITKSERLDFCLSSRVSLVTYVYSIEGTEEDIQRQSACRKGFCHFSATYCLECNRVVKPLYSDAKVPLPLSDVTVVPEDYCCDRATSTSTRLFFSYEIQSPALASRICRPPLTDSDPVF